MSEEYSLCTSHHPLDNDLVLCKIPSYNEFVCIRKNSRNSLKVGRHISAVNRDENFIPILTREGIHRVLIAGPTGSGKSYLLGQMLEGVDKPIYLFSKLSEDPSLDKFIDPQRISIDSLVENPIDISQLADSIVIFDDFETCSDKKVVKELLSLRDKILETGRHYNIYCISTTHFLCNNLKTRQSLLECDLIISFHKGGGRAHLLRLMKEYLGLTPTQTQKVLKNARGKWIGFYRNSPNAVITEKDVDLLE
jgi:energy-coupling factor transporter ATP-binding protein EcfA2